MWLSSADLAISRVAERVRMGGHHVPEEIVRRRYEAGLTNLRELYLPLADSWQMIDNTEVDEPRLIAAGLTGRPTEVYVEDVWNRIIKITTPP